MRVSFAPQRPISPTGKVVWGSMERWGSLVPEGLCGARLRLAGQNSHDLSNGMNSIGLEGHFAIKTFPFSFGYSLCVTMSQGDRAGIEGSYVWSARDEHLGSKLNMNGSGLGKRIRALGWFGNDGVNQEA